MEEAPLQETSGASVCPTSVLTSAGGFHPHVTRAQAHLTSPSWHKSCQPRLWQQHGKVRIRDRHMPRAHPTHPGKALATYPQGAQGKKRLPELQGSPQLMPSRREGGGQSQHSSKPEKPNPKDKMQPRVRRYPTGSNTRVGRDTYGHTSPTTQGLDSSSCVFCCCAEPDLAFVWRRKVGAIPRELNQGTTRGTGGQTQVVSDPKLVCLVPGSEFRSTSGA